MGYFPAEDRRHEIRSPALNLVRCPRLAREKRSSGGLCRDDLHVGTRKADHFAGAGQRAPRAPARDEEIEPLAGEILQDFRSGGAAVVSGIRLVLELTRE